MTEPSPSEQTAQPVGIPKGPLNGVTIVDLTRVPKTRDT